MRLDRLSREASIVVPVFIAGILTAAPSFGQFSWDGPRQNLKVLPDSISDSELRSTMIGFARSLGVRCYFCHDDTKGRDLDELDFASDAKPEKDIARLMMRMVIQINREYVAKVSHGPSKDEPSIPVTCVTCHRGANRPRPLEDVLAETIEAEGIDAAREEYYALRERYYGRMAYDFSPGTLSRLGHMLLAKAELDAALEIMKLNVDVNPDAAEAVDGLGDAYLASGDTVRATVSYERALELNPGNERVSRKLEALR